MFISFKINKLSLYIKKINVISFKCSRGKVLLKSDLTINDTKIDRAVKIEFLAVFIDERLTFVDHIQYIQGKIARKIVCKHSQKKHADHPI